MKPQDDGPIVGESFKDATWVEASKVQFFQIFVKSCLASVLFYVHSLECLRIVSIPEGGVLYKINVRTGCFVEKFREN